MSLYFPDATELGRHTVFQNVQLRTMAGDHLQLSLAVLPADSAVDWHAHPNEQCGYVVAGAVLFEIGDEKKELHPGDFFRIPGGVRHRVQPIGGSATVLDVFYPIRDEYR